ncbi:MAG: CpXC domain-containing protein [Chloroflexales bacterium]|jgi:CpXC protein
MPISYQEQAELTCPSCGSDFAAAVWLILDAQEQPGAVNELRHGSLNNVTCPHCGNSGPAGAPLLFHDGQARRVIFAGVPGAAEHEVRDQARHLHTLLVESIPDEQRRAYLADVDIAQDVDGVAHMLKRMDRRRGGVETPRRGVFVETPHRGVSTPETPPLLVAVQELLEAASPEDLNRVIAEHPALLARDTDLTLAQLADVAFEQRAHDIVESLQRARRLLDEMSSAIEERREALAKQRPAHATATAAVTGIADSEEPTLEEAIEALLSADGEEELADALDHYPLLLDDAASHALRQFAAEARASGNEAMARYIIECREMLRRVREGLDG